MPKLQPEMQSARRERILDAAEKCFIEAGFHAATISDICREANVSAGALYIYFPSKDDIIIGLCERECERFSAQLARLASSSNFLDALRAMAEHFCCEEPRQKALLNMEIAAEAGRNPRVAEQLVANSRFIRESFIALLRSEHEAGRLSLAFSPEIVTRAMSAIGDGLFMHRAVEPDFDPKPVIPAIMKMVAALIATPSQG
jgi:AcrR family transcriptional regulator